MANENDVVRLKHLNSLASVVHDITLHSGGDSQALPDNADFALYVPNDTSIIITGKQSPVLSLGSWSSADTVYSAPITYTGDGTLSTDIGTISNDILTVADADGNFNGVISASAGDDYSATKISFDYNTETNIVDVLSDPLEFVLAGTSFAFNEDNVFRLGLDTVSVNDDGTHILLSNSSSAYPYQVLLNIGVPTWYHVYKLSESTGFILYYCRYPYLIPFNITPDGKFSVTDSYREDKEYFYTHGAKPNTLFPALCNPLAAFYCNNSTGMSNNYLGNFTCSSQIASLSSNYYLQPYFSFSVNGVGPNSAETVKGKPPVISYNGQDVTLAEGTTEVNLPVVLVEFSNGTELALTYSGLPNDSIATYTVASANRDSVNAWLTDEQYIPLGAFYNKSKSATYFITYKPGTYSKATYLDDAFNVWGFMFDQSTHNTATLIKSSKKLSDILDDIAI